MHQDSDMAAGNLGSSDMKLAHSNAAIRYSPFASRLKQTQLSKLVFCIHVDYEWRPPCYTRILVRQFWRRKEVDVLVSDFLLYYMYN